MTLADLLIIPAVLIAFAIAWPALFQIVNSLVPGFTGTGLFSGTSLAILLTLNGLVTSYDNAFLLIAFGLGLAVVLSSFYIDSNPAFFFISLIVWLTSMILAPLYANFFNTYINSGSFIGSGFDVAARMPLMTAILTNFPAYMLFVGALTFLGLYAKFAKGRE